MIALSCDLPFVTTEDVRGLLEHPSSAPVLAEIVGTVPVPLRLTVTGLATLPPSCPIDSVPAGAAPAAPGANSTITVQLPPAATSFTKAVVQVPPLRE